MAKTGKTRNAKKTPKTRQTTKKSANNSSDGKENTPRRKENTKKPNPNDTIAMSKQLTLKKQAQKRVFNNKVKACPNGKPMPSLADLEKMFEDSDTEDTNKLVQQTSTVAREAPKTPTKNAPTCENKILSPGTIKNIADHLINVITNEPVKLLAHFPLASDLTPPDDAPPPPVIPLKKRKMSEIPYIVGCKDRPQVCSNPKTIFRKGDDEYCVCTNNENEAEDSCPSKQSKNSRVGAFSKSIFNAQSDVIANRLKALEDNVHSGDSNDSSRTEIYELNTNSRPCSPFARFSFSPLPSTSRDNEIFVKNDELFNESLTINSSINKATEQDDTDIEIIEVPCETVVINDGNQFQNTQKETKTNSCVQIIGPVRNETSTKPLDKSNIDDDDDCILIDDSIVENTKIEAPNNMSTIVEEYSGCTIVETDNVQDEVIDIDDLIEQNKAIIEKIKDKRQSNSVIEVVEIPNSPSPEVQQSGGDNTSNNNESSGNENNSQNNCVNSHINGETLVKEVISPNKSNSVPNSSDLHRKSTLAQKMLNAFISDMRICGILNTISTLSGCRNYIDLTNNHVNTEISRNQVQNNNTVSSTLQSNSLPVTNDTNPKRENCTMQQMHNQILASTALVQTLPSNPYASINSHQTITLSKHGRNKKTMSTSQPTVVNPQQSFDSPQRSCEKSIGECPICMESLSTKAIASTTCGHVFCLKCIQTAIKASGKRCPTCRKGLKGIGYHQLYL